MKAYNYDRITNEYTGESEADESPLEPNVFLFAAYSTDKQPSVSEKNQIAIFENNDWIIKDDYRNQKCCEVDSNNLFVQAHELIIGEKPSSTLVLTDIPDINIYKPKWDDVNNKWIQGEDRPLNEVQLEKKNEINSICEERIYAGFYSYAEGTKDTLNNPIALLYKCDDKHQTKLFATYALALQHKSGALTNYPCSWKSANQEDEVCHDVLDDCVIQLYFDEQRHIKYNTVLSDTLIQQIMACTTVSDIEKIIYPDTSIEPLPPVILS